MKRHILYVSTLLILTLTSHAFIIETDAIETVLEHVNQPNTLVVFDLDNTLMHPEGTVGSNEWFSYLLSEKLNAGFSHHQAIILILPDYFHAEWNITMKLTDPIIPHLLKSLTDQNINTMALTARHPYLAEITHEHFRKLNITFALNSTDISEMVMPFQQPCLYRYNTLFVGDNDKGKSLAYFLDCINYHPEKIVFVDDKAKYHYLMKEAFDGILELCCIRYSGCDELVAQFDPIKAQEELDALYTK